MNLEDHEWGLCIGALECASKELRDGLAASTRLGLPMPDGIETIAAQMDTLRDKIMSELNDDYSGCPYPECAMRNLCKTHCVGAALKRDGWVKNKDGELVCVDGELQKKES